MKDKTTILIAIIMSKPKERGKGERGKDMQKLTTSI